MILDRAHLLPTQIFECYLIFLFFFFWFVLKVLQERALSSRLASVSSAAKAGLEHLIFLSSQTTELSLPKTVIITGILIKLDQLRLH